MDTFLEHFLPFSVALGAAAVLGVSVLSDAIGSWRRRRAQKPRAPIIVSDVIAVPPEQVAELLRGNGAPLPVEQARSLLGMMGPVGEAGYHFLMRRLGVVQADNPGRQFLVLIEPR